MIKSERLNPFLAPLATAVLIGAAACGTTEAQAYPCTIAVTSNTGFEVDFALQSANGANVAPFGTATEYLFDYGDGKTGSEKTPQEDHTFDRLGTFVINGGFRDYYNPDSTYRACAASVLVLSAQGKTSLSKSNEGAKRSVVPSSRASGFPSGTGTPASTSSPSQTSANKPSATMSSTLSSPKPTTTSKPPTVTTTRSR